MDLISYLRIFRRRWLILLVPMVAALAISWLTLPKQTAPTAPVAPSYSAKATLIISPTYDNTTQPVNLPRVVLFATLGQVPERAAKQLHYHGEPQILASQVAIVANTTNGTVTVSSTDSNAKALTSRVNAFADQTVSYFADKQREDTKSRIAAAKAQLKVIGKQLKAVQGAGAAHAASGTTPGAGSGDATAQAKAAALKSQYSAQYGTIVGLQRHLGGSGPLEVLQPAVAIPQSSGAFTPPTNPWARLGISAVLGLLLGAALALLVERLDSRLRTREQVEESFGLPVLAEVPALPLGQRGKRAILSADMPASATAEAHRSLRSAVLLLGPDGRAADGARSSAGSSPLIVLVTSALPNEGKTTTVANLAAVMAEAGRSVLVLSFDLRNPRLHEYFETENGVGVSDLLAPRSHLTLDSVARQTRLAGVELVTSGQRLDHPGALLASAGPLLRAARERADVVLIDTAPMLTASDAIDLAQYVDVALLVSRLNKTTTTHAAAAQRLLSRLGVPALGTVLVGSRSAGSHSSGAYRMAGLAHVTRTADDPESTAEAARGAHRDQ
jgi:capsular exopolysaccharide synthesis family protein